MQLQRLVLDFRAGEVVVRCLYRSQDGTGPSTKARTRKVTALVRTGLEQALEALDGEAGAECDRERGERRGAGRDAERRLEESRKSWRRNHPGEKGGGKGPSGGGRRA